MAKTAQKKFNWPDYMRHSRAELGRLLKLDGPLTQSAMADLLGVSRNYLASIETGRREPSRLFAVALTACRILAARGIDPRQRVLPE